MASPDYGLVASRIQDKVGNCDSINSSDAGNLDTIGITPAAQVNAGPISTESRTGSTEYRLAQFVVDVYIGKESDSQHEQRLIWTIIEEVDDEWEGGILLGFDDGSVVDSWVQERAPGSLNFGGVPWAGIRFIIQVRFKVLLNRTA